MRIFLAKPGSFLYFLCAMNFDANAYDDAMQQVVELANRLADENPDSDMWDIADGLLAGVVHYWLFSRQPCGDPRCHDCSPVSTPEERLAELLRMARESVQQSEYHKTANDIIVGRA